MFPFGYGLSYTTFRLDHLDLNPSGSEVGVDVTNTGHRTGSEVVQVYVGGADGSGDLAPPRRLQGFAKVSLRPGEHRRVQVRLDNRAFAHWDTASQSWQVAAGAYQVLAGTSSRDLPLSATVHRGAATVQ